MYHISHYASICQLESITLMYLETSKTKNLSKKRHCPKLFLRRKLFSRLFSSLLSFDLELSDRYYAALVAAIVANLLKQYNVKAIGRER